MMVLARNRNFSPAATQQAIDDARVDQRFTADDIRVMHHRWLGELYEWAGEYRTVNLSKGGVHICRGGESTRINEGVRAWATSGIHAL